MRAVHTETNYCRGCGTERRWRYLRTDHHPDINHWRCLTCGIGRVAYGNVPDVDGLCRTVLQASLVVRNAGVVPPLGDPVSYDGLDYLDALGQLAERAWIEWARFDQSYGEGTGSFRGLLTMRLQQRLISWYRRQRVYGTEGRILVSLEGLDAGTDDTDRPVEGGLERALRSLGGNAGVDRSPDLQRAIARGNRVRDRAV